MSGLRSALLALSFLGDSVHPPLPASQPTTATGSPLSHYPLRANVTPAPLHPDRTVIRPPTQTFPRPGSSQRSPATHGALHTASTRAHPEPFARHSLRCSPPH